MRTPLALYLVPAFLTWLPAGFASVRPTVLHAGLEVASEQEGRAEVRFDLTLDKARYEVGEPIVLNIRLTNVGSAPVGMPVTSDVTGRHDGYVFTVTDTTGTRVADPGGSAISLMHSLGGVTAISPMQLHARELVLNYRIAPLAPGRYFVHGMFAPRAQSQDIRAESASVPFEIVPTPAVRMRKRIAELASEIGLPAGARRVAPLLGFTGDSRALPVLIDILYSADGGARAAAADALLYFDRSSVKDSLLESIRARGPRDRLVEVLVVKLGTDRAEVNRLLLRWLADPNGEARVAAVEGIRLANRPADPALFAPLAAMLEDPIASVRHAAAAAVGGYQNAAALKALKGVVDDPDPHVSEQAAIAVGWVAEASATGGATRRDAVEILRRLQRSGGHAGRQAAYWLARIKEQ